MNSVDKKLVTTVINDVLRRFVFMMLEPAEGVQLKLKEEEFYFVELRTEGRFNTTFSLYAPKSLSLQFSANILGTDIEDPIIKDNPDDGVKELLNIISSHVLTKMAGSQDLFYVGLAKADLLTDKTIWESVLSEKNQTGFQIEGKPLIFRIEHTL